MDNVPLVFVDFLAKGADLESQLLQTFLLKVTPEVLIKISGEEFTLKSITVRLKIYDEVVSIFDSFHNPMLRSVALNQLRILQDMNMVFKDKSYTSRLRTKDANWLGVDSEDVTKGLIDFLKQL